MNDANAETFLAGRPESRYARLSSSCGCAHGEAKPN